MRLNHITFIRPNIGDFRAGDAMEPVVFAILAARTPKHINIAFFDDRLESIPLEIPTDLVAITVETFTARRAYQIAGSFRSKGVTVIMGGYHPTLLPEECAEHADAIVCGDAEGIWEQLLHDAEHDQLKPVYRQTGSTPMSGPLPDRHIFRDKNYAPIALVQYGRGCRFNCDFCSIHAYYGREVMQRPICEVVREITTLNRKLVLFVDDNIFSNVRNTEALCRAIKPLNIRWICQVSIDIVRHDRLLKLMRDSGCFLALIGFESLDENNLKQMHKKWNVKRDYSQAVQKLHQHGIMVYGTFVFGYDHDDIDSFERALNFSLQHNFFLANFNPLTPTPGTELYNRLKRQNKLVYDQWWNDPNYRYGQTIFKPKKMTDKELSLGCFNIRTKFYQMGSILKRSMNRPVSFYKPYNLGSYFLANLISRREINTKQNQALGYKLKTNLSESVEAS